MKIITAPPGSKYNVHKLNNTLRLTQWLPHRMLSLLLYFNIVVFYYKHLMKCFMIPTYHYKYKVLFIIWSQLFMVFFFNSVNHRSESLIHLIRKLLFYIFFIKLNYLSEVLLRSKWVNCTWYYGRFSRAVIILNTIE